MVFDLRAGLSRSDLTGMMGAALTAQGNKQFVSKEAKCKHRTKCFV